MKPSRELNVKWSLLIVFTYHHPANRLTLRNLLDAVSFSQVERSTTNNKTINQRGDIMAEEKVQDYTDDKNEGHVDTREKNFDCENKDENLGCDPGIDVAG
jgi:hypothetical protein